MKPAPPRKPKRIRVVLVYTVPADLYRGIDIEVGVLRRILLYADGRILKSSRLRLEAWGKGNGGYINRLIKTIDSKAKNTPTKINRYIDFSGLKPKNSKRSIV